MQRWWTWHEVFLLRTKNAPSIEAVGTLTRAMLAHSNSVRTGMGLIIVLEQVTAPPSEPVRKAMSAQFDRFGSKLKGLAYVVESTGFAAAAVRALIATTHTLQRRPYPQRTAANADEALKWLLTKLDGGAARASDFDAARAALSAQ